MTRIGFLLACLAAGGFSAFGAAALERGLGGDVFALAATPVFLVVALGSACMAVIFVDMFDMEAAHS